MIQPSFTFLVGTSMAFSLVARSDKGQSFARMLIHAIGRSLILVFLGIFLRSLGKPSTNFTFDDTLTQIGLGYWILFLLSNLSWRGISISLAIVLIGYWAAFVLYPAPSADFAYSTVGVPNEWPEHWKEGIAVHFNKNSNLAWAFDTWWMNLFSPEKRFEFSGGGYCTLSFIPTLGTMILGLIAGRLLQQPSEWSRKFWSLVLAGAACLAIAYAVHWTDVCPIVKRIWTPSWTLWSGGLCFFWLASLSLICDRLGWVSWGFPWIVIGANSIVAYVMSWTIEASTIAAIKRHFGSWVQMGVEWATSMFGAEQSSQEKLLSLTYGALTLCVFWLILLWLYRRKIFVKI
jgi:predicted acyltransferase